MGTRKYLILDLLKNHNAKITEMESKIPSITSSATFSRFNVQNKISDITDLVKKNRL